MTTIGGPPGIGGPKGPAGPEPPSEPSHSDEVAADASLDRAAAIGITETAEIEALVAELAAGRVTRSDAIDRLLEATAGPELPGLDDAERAELRELLGDLIANDPHLSSLIGRI